MKKYILLAACTLGLSLSSCEDFLDYTPTAVVDEDKEVQVQLIPVTMPLISGLPLQQLLLARWMSFGIGYMWLFLVVIELCLLWSEMVIHWVRM